MKRFLASLQLFALALLVPIAPTAANAQSSKPVTLAVQLSSDVPQILLANDRKLWQKAGIDVRLIPTATGRETLEALAGGQADFAVFADLPATIAVLRKQPLLILADVARYNGQRAIGSKKRMRKFDSPADMNGLRVGTTLGTSVEYLAALLLERGNAKAEIVNSTPADIVPALVRGDIDVSVPFPSVYAQAKKLLGPDYLELKAKNYAAHILLAASPAMVKERPADVEKFLKGVLMGDDLTKSDPAAAKDAVLRASRGVMTPDVLDSMWPDYDHHLVLKSDLLKFMSDEASWVAKKGMIKVEPGMTGEAYLRTYFHPESLAKLAPDRVQLSK
jgi:ABC-type nitrate/sulfonate/bicarbonate transport system substrate-binding protein